MATVKSNNREVHVLEMKDGDVAVITRWDNNPSYVDRVVQRYYKFLLSVGMTSGHGWGEVFDRDRQMEGCYVEILNKGAEIVL